MMQRRKVSDSVPHMKARGKKLPKAEKMELGMGDPSDSSEGHDSGAGKAKPAVMHKGPDKTK